MVNFGYSAIALLALRAIGAYAAVEAVPSASAAVCTCSIMPLDMPKSNR